MRKFQACNTKVIKMSKEDKETMSTFIEAIPQMLKSLVLAPYSEDSAKQVASATILFYKELKKSGISEAFAKRLTEMYLGDFRITTGPTQLSFTR
jgi:hypothetical protein